MSATLGGMVMGDMLGAVGSPTLPASSSASKPDNAKKTRAAESDQIQQAKRTLWISATIVVGSIVVLGFGSKLLNNVRIA